MSFQIFKKHLDSKILSFYKKVVVESEKSVNKKKLEDYR